MLNITLLTSVAKSAFVGAVATKLVDTFISTKINTKIEIVKIKMDRDGKIKKTLLIKTPENFVILSSDEFKKLAIPLNNIIKILLKLYDTRA